MFWELNVVFGSFSRSLRGYSGITPSQLVRPQSTVNAIQYGPTESCSEI